MRRDGRLLALAIAAGVAVAAVVTVLQDSVYRADASVVLVRRGQPPGDDPALAQAAAAAARLFDSRAVAESAIANLRLDESPQDLLDRIDLDAEPESSLVRIEVEGSSREEARRTAQEVTEVATVLYNDRFGPETVASIWEAPRAEDDRISPRPAWNLALGAIAGVVGGRVLLLLLRRRRPETPPAPVTRPAPALVEPDPEPAPASAPAAEPGPEPAREPTPFVEPRLGEWTLRDVELLFAEQGPAFPDRQEELGWYLDSLRAVASEGGRLPDGVEGVVEEVFAPLLARARTGE